MSGDAGAEADAATFELDRFDWNDGRLELRGRWSGIRGRRFMRPTLTLHGADGHHRLLAVLDHKPWEPDGPEWIAAFAWDGEPGSFDEAELSVAPGLDVVLPAPAANGRKKPRKRGELFEARDLGADPPAVPVAQPRTASELKRASEQPPVERVADEMAARRAEIEGLHERIAQLEAEVSNATSRAELEAAAREQAESERDALADERDAVIRERDSALSARDVAESERDLVRRELDAAAGVLSRSSDATSAELDAALRERDAIAAERDAALREKAALESAAIRRTARDPRRPRAQAAVADWTPRLVAIGIFLAFALVVLLLFHGDL